MNELALFAGAGGGILGGHLLGWRTVCAVEYDCYAASVLMQRQNDGLLPTFPVWDDVRTFDGRPWRHVVDVVSGGFPCQDISAAGKGGGIENGERSGLWVEMARIIGEVRPRFCFVENSPILASRGLGRVLGDLAAMGYDAEWGVLGAADVGAPHQRERIWIVAYSDEIRWGRRSGMFGESRRLELENGGCIPDTDCQHVYDSGFRAGKISQQQTASISRLLPHADSDQHKSGSHARSGQGQVEGKQKLSGDTNGTGLEKRKGQRGDYGEELSAIIGADWWAVEPNVGRVADGVAARVDRLKAIGNGQVPQCAAEAWLRLLARFGF